MVLFCTTKSKTKENAKKLNHKVSWLMGRVQKSLLPHLNECFETLLTEQEERLVSILEIVQVEKYVSNPTTYRWKGRKPLDRQSLARAFVAKALYRIPTTIDLIRALQATKNLRHICGFSAMGELPSESTFSRVFTEFAVSELGKQAHDSLVQEYLSDELIGHISQDSTAIVGREKPAKKVKVPKQPRKRGRPAKGEKREPAPLKRLDRQIALSVEEAVIDLPTLCDRGTDMVNTVNSKQVSIASFATGLPVVSTRLSFIIFPVHGQRRGHHLTTVDQSDMRGLGTV